MKQLKIQYVFINGKAEWESHTATFSKRITRLTDAFITIWIPFTSISSQWWVISLNQEIFWVSLCFSSNLLPRQRKKWTTRVDSGHLNQFLTKNFNPTIAQWNVLSAIFGDTSNRINEIRIEVRGRVHYLQWPQSIMLSDLLNLTCNHFPMAQRIILSAGCLIEEYVPSASGIRVTRILK